MKLVMIHGQNHRGSTYRMAHILAEKMHWQKEGWLDHRRPWKQD